MCLLEKSLKRKIKWLNLKLIRNKLSNRLKRLQLKKLLIKLKRLQLKKLLIKLKKLLLKMLKSLLLSRKCKKSKT